MDPVTAPSSAPRAVEEDDHHEKKPALKKVKEKVKKIKNTITKKAHGHGGTGDDDDHHQHGDLGDRDEGYEEDEEIEEDPEVHGAPIYESSTAGSSTGAKEMSRGGGDGVGVGLGLITTEFVEDPVAPTTASETESRMEQSRGGEEVELSPDLRRSFEAMSVSNKSGGGETELSKDKSYTEKLSSAKDVAGSVASKVYEKVAEAGTAVMSKVKPDTRKDGGDEATRKQDKRVSIKEYVVEKLTPGEEDKALSEVITEAVQKRKGAAVAAPPPERTGSGQDGGGVGVVQNLRERVTSFLGGAGGAGRRE